MILVLWRGSFSLNIFNLIDEGGGVFDMLFIVLECIGLMVVDRIMGVFIYYSITWIHSLNIFNRDDTNSNKFILYLFKILISI